MICPKRGGSDRFHPLRCDPVRRSDRIGRRKSLSVPLRKRSGSRGKDAPQAEHMREGDVSEGGGEEGEETGRGAQER
jgi:hypothetical protein